jgi:hypothetical protein
VRAHWGQGHLAGQGAWALDLFWFRHLAGELRFSLEASFVLLELVTSMEIPDIKVQLHSATGRPSYFHHNKHVAGVDEVGPLC